MRLAISILLITSTVLVACGDVVQETPADFVMLNGGIYTVDAERSWAEAVAIVDGVIVAVGNNDAIQPYIGADTEVVDLAGRMAMPGIHDSHVHPLEGGYEQLYCNLWNVTAVAEIIEVLRTCGENVEGEWFNAVGLQLGSFGLIGADKSILDGIADGKYIFVDGADGHSALVNQEVLDLVAYNDDTPDPVDGVIERREGSSEPNGFVRESARHKIDRLRPPRDPEISIAAMHDAIDRMNSFGITSAYDVWVGELEMQIYQALSESGDLSVRILGGITDEGQFEKHVGADLERVIEGRVNYESEHLSLNSIKFLVDGVFEGETAALLEPYQTIDHAGVLNMTPEVLKERVTHYYNKGMQLHFHTMGDRAVRESLDAIEFARAQGDKDHLSLRHTLSHIGLVGPADLPRFAELNTAASFTLEWADTDEWTVNLEIPALGRERVSRLYPIRSIRDAGGVVLGSSDWNYGELDPLLSIEAGVTRDDVYGATSSGEFEVFREEIVDLATMIDAYTINGAWQIHAEDVSGSIETGKRADVVVYDHNLFEIDPYEISEALVDLTIFDGHVVYRRGDD
jgi:predicted amidohydrolase YtcJ